MKASERELLGLASAAALGMGYPHGVCEDLARAVVWLVQRDADGLGALAVSAPRVGAPLLTARSRPIVVDGVRVGSDGPGLVDLLLAARSGDGLAQPGEPAQSGERVVLRLTGLDSPLLMIGLCGAMAKATGTSLELRIGDGDTSASPGEALAWVVGDGDRIDRGQQETMVGAVEVSCRTSATQVDAEPPPPIRLVVPDRRWAEAEGLAARTYVPASEQSRHHGAGAGLTDND